MLVGVEEFGEDWIFDVDGDDVDLRILFFEVLSDFWECVVGVNVGDDGVDVVFYLFLDFWVGVGVVC